MNTGPRLVDFWKKCSNNRILIHRIGAFSPSHKHPSSSSSSHTVTRRGIGCHERCESWCPQKAPFLIHRRLVDLALRRSLFTDSSSLLRWACHNEGVSSRRAPPIPRIPRAWIKGRALGWLVLIYPRASVFSLLLFRRFSRAPDLPLLSLSFFLYSLVARRIYEKERTREMLPSIRLTSPSLVSPPAVALS